MISCEIFLRHVDVVIDGEVDPTTRLELDEHLARCESCREHLELADAFKREVGRALAPSPAPSALRDRIRGALDAEDGALPSIEARPSIEAPRPSQDVAGIRLPFVRPRYAIPAAAAAVALAVIAAREGGNPVEDDASVGRMAIGQAALFEDVVSRHSLEHPAEVRAAEPRQVTGWFQDKLAFPVAPIEFDRPDVRLVGARLSRVENRDAASLYYDVQGRRVTVLVFQPPSPVMGMAERTDVAGHGVYFGRARGHVVPLMQHRNVTYAIAGDLDNHQLLQLAASAHVRTP